MVTAQQKCETGALILNAEQLNLSATSGSHTFTWVTYHMQEGETRLVQPGDQVCTAASQLPFSKALLHGIVLSCSRNSVIVTHFQEDGVQEKELFGAFASSEVWLLDYWDAGQGLGVSAAPSRVTLERIEWQLKHPNLQPRYTDSSFNSEHWATKMKGDDTEFADGFCKKQYKCKEGKYNWRKG